MSQPAAPAKKGLSGRAIGGIVIAAVALIFSFTNWQSVEVKSHFLPHDAARDCIGSYRGRYTEEPSAVGCRLSAVGRRRGGGAAARRGGGAAGRDNGAG